MRNHFMPQEAEQTIAGADRRNELGSKAKHPLENQKAGGVHENHRKRMGRSDGAGRVLFYRDENDGSDHLL